MWNNVVDVDEAIWQHVIDVNVGGYFRFAKYAIPLIRESGGGTIINMPSITADLVNSNWSPYPVTKAAIQAFTRTLAIDFAPQIRANAICPGFVAIANSELDRTAEEIEAWHAAIAERIPMGRVCSTEDVAGVACFLASDESAHITGTCITVDGGQSVWDPPLAE